MQGGVESATLSMLRSTIFLDARSAGGGIPISRPLTLATPSCELLHLPVARELFLFASPGGESVNEQDGEFARRGVCPSRLACSDSALIEM